MKGIDVHIRKITLQDIEGYHSVRWYHPTQELPAQFTNHCRDILTVHADEILHGVVVSDPFIFEEAECVVVKVGDNSRFQNFKTFWIGYLG